MCRQRWQMIGMIGTKTGSFSTANPCLDGLCQYIWVNYNDLTVLPHWKSWFISGKSSPNGRTIQVSEILFHLPRYIQIYQHLYTDIYQHLMDYVNICLFWIPLNVFPHCSKLRIEAPHRFAGGDRIMVQPIGQTEDQCCHVQWSRRAHRAATK